MTARTVDGVLFRDVPEGWTDDQIREWAGQTGAAELQANPPPTDNVASPEWQEWAQNQSPLMAGILQARQFLTNRLPSLNETSNRSSKPLPPEAMQALQSEYPIATGIGNAFFPVSVGMALPSAGLTGIGVQSVAQAGLTALDPNADMTDVAQSAALAGGGTIAGNTLSRVATGIARGVNAARGAGQPLTTTSQTARLVSETGLGRGVIKQVNENLLIKDIGRVLGVSVDDGLNASVLANAADEIGGLYDDALRITGVADVSDVVKTLDDIPAGSLPGKKRILNMLAKPLESDSLRGAHAALRDLSSKMRSSPTLAGFAGEVDEALKALNKAAAEAGADPSALGQAGQRWKILKNLEELPGVWLDEGVPARQLVTRLARETRKGFGTTLKRGKTDQLLPEVSKLLDDLKTVGRDLSAVGDSGTSSRLLTTGVAGGSGVGLLTGAIDPTTAASLLVGQAVIPPIAAAASVGRVLPGVGGAAAGAAQGLSTSSE